MLFLLSLLILMFMYYYDMSHRKLDEYSAAFPFEYKIKYVSMTRCLSQLLLGAQ